MSIGKHRSSTIYILFRIWIIFTLPIVAFYWASGGNPLSATFGWGGFVAFCMSWSFPIASVGMRLAGPFLWGDEWHYFRQSGGRPLLDALPWPFNPQSYWVRVGGLPEPNYRRSPTGFVPPPSWEYQCPSCGARVPEQFVICWHCNGDWLNGNGEGSTYAPYQGQAAAIDQAIPRTPDPVHVKKKKKKKKKNKIPTIYGKDTDKPYCLDDDGRRYWWYDDGEIFYWDEVARATPSDPSLVSMHEHRR